MHTEHPSITRLAALRGEMNAKHIDFYLVTSSDFHASEYVGDYFKVSEYLSACTSDNVLLLIGKSEARLWTDGRYFISAAAELSGSEILLMKEGESGVPTLEQYLAQCLFEGACLAFDGRCVSAAMGRRFRDAAQKAGAICDGSADLISGIWTDRPALASHPVMILPDEIAGARFAEKCAEVRKKMAESGAHYLAVSTLDDIMWLLNIRGGDVECNPVALSYLLLGEETCDLFIQESEVTEEFRQYAAKEDIRLHPYDSILSYLSGFPFDQPVLVDPAGTSDAMLHLLKEKASVIEKENPVLMMKACKNETEMENIRKYYLLDSVALCRFIFYVKKNIGRIPMTEISAAHVLDDLRRAVPGFLDLSFPTIPAYNANAAMAHYAPSEEDCAVLAPSGFLLVDSGGQYLGATTDVTRTIVLGPLTQEMKRDFTLVAAGNLRLLYAKFREGMRGSQLDILARGPLYAHGMDYNHGTGHGIGYILNVHEGPQRIGTSRSAKYLDPPILPGMVTSDEPGLYRENEYGIRTESITLAVPAETTEFGNFLRFEALTFAPIDLDAIDPAYLTAEDVRLLNNYHALVFEKVSPYLEGEELEFLRDATRAI